MGKDIIKSDNDWYTMITGKEYKLMGYDLLRVPGGWILSCPSFGIFIPFNNEFMKQTSQSKPKE